MMEMMRSMCVRLEALEARSRPTQPAAHSALPTLSAQQSTQSATQLATQSDILQEEEQCSTENIAETVSSSSDTTGLLSTVSHQSTQPVQEEELQQANAENTAENTAEKPSGNKATIIKNTA